MKPGAPVRQPYIYSYSAPIDFSKIPAQTIKQDFFPSLGDPIVLLIQTKNTYYPSDMIDR
jgi:hypothetical protein